MSSPLSLVSEKPWYSQGLSFKCTGCGKCCTGSPGYAFVTEEEIQMIADFLKISLDECAQKYIRRVDERYALLETRITYDCIFLKENKCQIYPVRPTQCRTFPWWAQNLKSPEDWERAAIQCEGINPSFPKVSFEEIKGQLVR